MKTKYQQEQPYRVLGVSQGATESEIKKAFRTLAKKFQAEFNLRQSRQNFVFFLPKILFIFKAVF